MSKPGLDRGAVSGSLPNQLRPARVKWTTPVWRSPSTATYRDVKNLPRAPTIATSVLPPRVPKSGASSRGNQCTRPSSDNLGAMATSTQLARPPAGCVPKIASSVRPRLAAPMPTETGRACRAKAGGATGPRLCRPARLRLHRHRTQKWCHGDPRIQWTRFRPPWCAASNCSGLRPPRWLCRLTGL